MASNPPGTGARDAIGLLRAFLHFARHRTILAIALIAIGALVEGLGLLLLVPIIGTVLGHATPAILSPWLPAEPRRLPALLGAFILLIVVRAAILVVRDAVLARLQHGFVEHVRLEAIERIATAPWQLVAKLKQAEIVQVLGPDAQQIGVTAYFALQCVVAAVMLLANCALALVLAPGAAIAALLLFAPVAMVGLAFLPRMRAMGSRVLDEHQEMTGGTLRLLRGLKLATAENLRQGFVDDYRHAADAAVTHRIAFLRLQAVMRNLAAVLAALGGAAAIYVGRAGFGVEPALLIALVVVLTRIAAPVAMIQQGLQQIAHSLPAWHAVRSLHERLPADAAPIIQPIALAARPPSIEFHHASFNHVGTPGAGVHGITVRIAPGSIVGIGGPSGSGKTTFVDLAIGLLTTQSGTILLDGSALEGAVTPRHRIAYANQDPVLFGDTVRTMLTWGISQEVSDAEIWLAVRQAGADDFVTRSSGGLDSPLAERGTTLSAGERQRLALARALLRRPGLIVLDEATASIDLVAEQAIIAALRRLCPRPTVLLVSHRPESLALCDEILTFEKGRLTRNDDPGAMGIGKGATR